MSLDQGGTITGDPNFGTTPQQAAYLRFLQAALTGNNEELHDCIDAYAFAAFLPGQNRLVWELFRKFMATMHTLSPDFGQNVAVLDYVERDGTLCVMYRSVYTLNSQRVEHTSTDWVTFKDGRITELRVFYDRTDTREQVFGTRLTIGE